MPEYGPYEQPGWPSTLPYFKPGETFNRTMFGWAEVNRRRQQLENQLQQMAMKNYMAEQTYGLKEADFERKKDQFQQMMAWRDHNQESRDRVIQWHMDQENAKNDAIGDLAQGLGSVSAKYDANDPKRIPAAWEVIEKNSAGARAAPRLVQDFFNNTYHGISASHQRFGADMTDLQKRIRDTIGRGQSTDTDLLYHPERWKTLYTDPKGPKGNLHRDPPLDEHGVPTGYASGWVDSGMRRAEVKNVAAGQPGQDPTIPIEVEQRKIISLRKEVDDIFDRRQKLQPLPGSNDYFMPPSTNNQLSAQDQRMLDYAKTHPGDPSSAAIKAKLGVTD